MTIPEPWEATVLALAAFRVWRLLADDTILDRPRRWVLRLGDWREEGDKIPEGYRAKWGELIRCPWCLGFWVALGWWIAWLLWPTWALWVASPFMLSAVVGLVRENLDAPGE